jgi:hypothetical protein
MPSAWRPGEGVIPSPMNSRHLSVLILSAGTFGALRHIKSYTVNHGQLFHGF